MKRIIVIISAFLLISCNQVGDKSEVSTNLANSSNTKIEKSFISFRIHPPQSLPDVRFDELLELFEKYKGVTDEITFFTHTTHAPIPIDSIRQSVAILKDRMVEVRKRGYKTGINLLTTIGHHDENFENSLKGDYTYMTDIDGEICLGSFCPNDENMREYIRSIYQIVAKAHPDYIWIDDDIRLGWHHTNGLACFCDNCLTIFEEETGAKYTRESLKKAMNDGPVEEKLKLRKAWLQHNRNTIAHLFRLIEETVHGIDPDISLGFMTCDRLYEGYDFGNWAKILAGPNNTPVMWRPGGGGYYNDIKTNELAGKSQAIGRQVSVLPQEVLSIQSEIENFPYQRLKKAANIVVLEACSHIAAGCTGAAFNVLSMYDEPLDEFEPLVARLLEARPFFDLLAKSLGRSANTGIHTFWNKNSFVGNLREGNWLEKESPGIVDPEIFNIGLPASYSGEDAQVTILSKDNVFVLSKDEIKILLSKGVYMDAETLQQLNAMGFGELTGFEVVHSEDINRIEKFTNHSLNGDFEGRERNNRQTFYASPAYTLRKTSEKAQVLTSLIDYTGKEVSSCTMGIYENQLGGRICVSGYYPWSLMENLSKSSQMKSVFRWLSRDSLPGYIDSFHRVNLWIREPQNGKIVLAFTNSSFDPAKNIILLLRTENKTIKLYDMECRETIIRSSGTDGPYQKFVIQDVEPWQMSLVETY